MSRWPRTSIKNNHLRTRRARRPGLSWQYVNGICAHAGVSIPKRDDGGIILICVPLAVPDYALPSLPYFRTSKNFQRQSLIQRLRLSPITIKYDRTILSICSMSDTDRQTPSIWGLVRSTLRKAEQSRRNCLFSSRVSAILNEFCCLAVRLPVAQNQHIVARLSRLLGGRRRKEGMGLG